MLSISTTGADNKEGLQELREFDNLLNREFTITQKSSVKFTNIYYYYYYNREYLNTNRAAYEQQQSNIIHQANAYQGVNLIYAVDTTSPNHRL